MRHITSSFFFGGGEVQHITFACHRHKKDLHISCICETRYIWPVKIIRLYTLYIVTRLNEKELIKTHEISLKFFYYRLMLISIKGGNEMVIIM